MSELVTWAVGLVFGFVGGLLWYEITVSGGLTDIQIALVSPLVIAVIIIISGGIAAVASSEL